MQKRGQRSTLKVILLTIGAIFVVLFIFIPLLFSINGTKFGNVAIIPIEGPITGNGGSYLGQNTVSSQQIKDFIQQADKNSQVEVILLEINSPGGSAVASDEIALAVKKTEKPVVALIREAGASGGYWIASSADYVIANRMSITGSIGVISSYLEFSGLMEEHGVGYERLVSGQYKDLGAPYKKLSSTEKQIFQKKIDKIHQFFVEEVAANRGISVSLVNKMATGEFYLGVEAKELGLVDELGDITTAENYIMKTYNLEELTYVTYKREKGLLDLFSSVFTDFYFTLGKGIGTSLLSTDTRIMLI